jgi:5-carboxymethyl-2-hydroxymuconate isomerase
MPHLTVEYSDNMAELPADAVLLSLNETLVASGLFEAHDIKSRAVMLEEFLIGTSRGDQGFVHAKLSLLSGRSTEVRRNLSQSLLRTLQAVCGKVSLPPAQLCVEIIEIEAEVYSKATIG